MCCRLCSIGCNLIEKEEKYDPHVFSNMMFDVKFMIIGQNPGINECMVGVPFLGDAGKNFDEELKKNGLNRSYFYISNVVKCFSDQKLSTEKEICSSAFLENEIKIIKPKLIIVLNESSFNFFCPNEKYDDNLGKITNSPLGKIYAIYYPSSTNIKNSTRQTMFSRQIELLSKLIKKIS